MPLTGRIQRRLALCTTLATIAGLGIALVFVLQALADLGSPAVALGTPTVVMLALGVLGATVVTGVLVHLLVQRVLVRRITRAVDVLREAEAGDLLQRLEVTGADEFSDLERAFNGLMDRISDLTTSSLHSNLMVRWAQREVRLKEELVEKSKRLAHVNEQLLRRVGEASDLLQIAEAATASLEMDEMLRRVGRCLVGALGLREVAVMLADARTGELQVQHTVGVRDDEIARRERTRNPVVRAALERGGIEYVPDTAADERFRHETPGSFVAVPVRGRIVGVITLLRDERDAFRPEEIDFLRLVAHYVALAVSNAVLFRTTREQALEDPLTGLANRRSFMESYEVEWNLASRLGSPFAVLMLDVDFFKRFNDTFGHPVGDEVLKTIAQTVRSLVRKVDIVGRYGGEEFVVALPGASLDAAMDVAEKVRSTIRQLRFPMANGDGAHLAVSIGVASSNGGGVDAGELIRHADVALLAAKTLGRDRVEAYRAPPRR